MSSVSVRAALESALNAMTPIIAVATVSTSSISTATVITTAAAHGLSTGLLVTIAGHAGSTPSINGVRKITVLSPTTFSIPVTVTVAGTGGTVTANLTAWENSDFAPVTGVPYQECRVVWAQPGNFEQGKSYFEQGFMQVDLCYPAQGGTAVAAARAEAVRTAFKRGNTFTSGGITVTITYTPQILPGYPAEGVWVVPVRIAFQAQVSVA